MKYWIDFSGYVKVEADSKEEAESLFWRWFVQNCREPFSDDVWDIDGIEEAKEGDLLEPSSNEITAQDWEDFWHDR
jgi:hypothetical protein